MVESDSRLSTEVVEQRVRFRLQRQQRPMDDVTIIVGEAALRTVVGGPDILAEQLAHLREVAAAIRVLPFAAGAYPRRGSFALLDSVDDDDPPVAYVEGPGAARYFDTPDGRAEYEYVWQVLVDKSISIEEWP